MLAENDSSTKQPKAKVTFSHKIISKRDAALNGHLDDVLAENSSSTKN